MQETHVWSLGREDPLEKEMTTHSSTLAWKIPRTEEPSRLQSMVSQRVKHNWVTSLLLSFHLFLLYARHRLMVILHISSHVILIIFLARCNYIPFLEIEAEWFNLCMVQLVLGHKPKKSGFRNSSNHWCWQNLFSTRPHGLQPTRLLCPWNFPGKSTGVGCHCLLRTNT